MYALGLARQHLQFLATTRQAPGLSCCNIGY